MGPFGINQLMRRLNDARFLTGGGLYLDDIRTTGVVRGFVLHSPRAHAQVESIDAEGARVMPGVLGVFVVDDLASNGIGNART